MRNPFGPKLLPSGRLFIPTEPPRLITPEPRTVLVALSRERAEAAFFSLDLAISKLKGARNDKNRRALSKLQEKIGWALYNGHRRSHPRRPRRRRHRR